MSELLMTAEALNTALDDLAAQLIQKHGSCEHLVLVGIQRRGVDIARRLGVRMASSLSRDIPLGTLDISFYRDDWTTKGQQPSIHKTDILFSVNDKVLVLVDDVLYTGRTIRAALEALADFGRPSRVELLALVDRGHRELPIHADYTGLTLKTAKEDRVDVLMREHDGIDEVRLVRKA